MFICFDLLAQNSVIAAKFDHTERATEATKLNEVELNRFQLCCSISEYAILGSEVKKKKKVRLPQDFEQLSKVAGGLAII